VAGDRESILLTLKEPPFDQISKSKNEHEIIVNNHDEATVLLKQLGFIIDVSFKKHCQITQIQYCSYKINITLTDIEELSGTFMEIEVLTLDSDDTEVIFYILHELLVLFKVSSEQLCNEYYTEIKNAEVDKGRFITYLDCEKRQKTCVLGTYIAKKLFSGASPLGEEIKINGTAFTVVGVLEEKADSEDGSDDDIILIPYTSASRFSRTMSISSYSFSAVSTDTVNQAMAAINKKMSEYFTSTNYYSVFSASQALEQVDQMMGTVTLVLVGVAAISLLVGGIGIMNIMLVSVTERTREIGIRKSLGAKRRDIMSQFVVEAATTSSVGGIVGIIFGLASAYAIGKLFDMTVKPSVGAVVIAFSVSVVIGITFGYFPANKAAKMHPIDALRTD
jgi:putative ABC transport system permease protein